MYVSSKKEQILSSSVTTPNFIYISNTFFHDLSSLYVHVLVYMVSLLYNNLEPYEPSFYDWVIFFLKSDHLNNQIS